MNRRRSEVDDDQQPAAELRVSDSTKQVMGDALAYKMEEAAARCGLGRTTLFEAARRGELRVTKVGRRTIVLHDDLVDWLHRRREAA